MLRCGLINYCLQFSLVCDGQEDYPYGDDEASCSGEPCPGLLKCRGEVRCVGCEQICDGYTKCILSFDDEILCDNYPTNHCKCDSYLLYCTVNSTLYTIIINKLYSKDAIFKGT